MARTTRAKVERALADGAREPAAEPLAAAAEVELALSDLVGDDNGEIVFCNDSGFRSLALHTDSRIVADGRAKAHITAAGEDVSGFKFANFDNGLTLFYEEGLHLIVSSAAASSPA